MRDVISGLIMRDVISGLIQHDVISILIQRDIISVSMTCDVISGLMMRDVISVTVTQLCVNVGGVNGPGADGLVWGAILHVARVQTRRKCQTVANRCWYWQEPLTGEIKTFEYTETRLLIFNANTVGAKIQYRKSKLHSKSVHF